MLIDTHTHINNVKDLDFLLEKCKENRVTELIAISTDINSSRENIKISRFIRYQVGETQTDG